MSRSGRRYVTHALPVVTDTTVCRRVVRKTEIENRHFRTTGVVSPMSSSTSLLTFPPPLPCLLVLTVNPPSKRSTRLLTPKVGSLARFETSISSSEPKDTALLLLVEATGPTEVIALVGGPGKSPKMSDNVSVPSIEELALVVAPASCALRISAQRAAPS